MIPTSAPQPRVITKNSGPMIPLGATIVTLLLVVAGSLGILLLQTPLQQNSQDTRSDASNSSGEVLVTTTPATTTKFVVGQSSKIDVQLNTQGKNVTELQLLFNVITNTTDEVILSTYSSSDLIVTKQEVEETSDGFLVAFEAKPAAGRTNFTNTNPLTVLNLTFNPKRAGTFKLDFDYDKSRAYTAEGDRLRGVGSIEYSAIALSASGLTCNSTCTGNDQCPTNHRCYENRCRLVTNVSSPTCAEPGAAVLQCNQACSGNSQCANDHVCYQGFCRRADNPTSTTCALSTATQQAEMQKSCNQPCTDNRGCAANLMCSQGFCRLPTNPSSTSCSSVKNKTVSGYYYGGSTSGQKGSDTPVVSPSPSTSPRPSLRPSPTATSSATVSGQVRFSPSPSIMPSSSPLPTALPEVIKPAANDSSTSFLDGLASRLAQGGNQALLLVLMGLGALMVLVALVLLISRLLGGRSNTSTTKTAQKAQTYEAELQKKIDALKQGTPAPQPPSALVNQPPVTHSPAIQPSITPPPSRMPSTSMPPSRFTPPVVSQPPTPPASVKPVTEPTKTTWPVTAPTFGATAAQPAQKPVIANQPPVNKPPVGFAPRPAAPGQFKPSLPLVKPALPAQKPVPTLEAETEPHLNLPAHSQGSQRTQMNPAPAKPTFSTPTNRVAHQPNRPSSMLERMKQRGIQPPGQNNSPKS